MAYGVKFDLFSTMPSARSDSQFVAWWRLLIGAHAMLDETQTEGEDIE